MTYTIRNYRDDRREPYAWPGGYPRFFLMEDGETLCHKCGREEWRVIVRNWTTRMGWKPEACDVNWEDSNLVCCNCGSQIEAAYVD